MSGSVNKWKLFIPHSVDGYTFLTTSKMYINFIIFNAFEIYLNALTRRFTHTLYCIRIFLCDAIYGVFSALRKTFQVAPAYNRHVEHQIWSFCYNLYLIYDDNRHTHAQIHTNQPLKMWLFYSISNITKFFCLDL